MSNDLFRYHLDKYRTNGRFPEIKSKVISIASGKGGVGKTFFSTNFAKFLAKFGYLSILLICSIHFGTKIETRNLCENTAVYGPDNHSHSDAIGRPD